MRVRLLLVLLVATALLTGCSRYTPTLVDKGSSYSRANIDPVLASVSVAAYSNTPVSKGPDLRTKALVALRAKGRLGDDIATLVTKTFPPATAAVPVYVEKATYEGQQAFIIVEAYGASGGNLEHKRLWIVSPTGELLFSAAAR